MSEGQPTEEELKNMSPEEITELQRKNCVFCKIIKGEIPSHKVYEDDNVLFFKDINPIAKVHVLGIPKSQCVDFYDFISKNTPTTISEFFKKTNLVIEKLGIVKDGYKVISNSGVNGGQEVPHFHIHILGGENLKGIR